MESLVFATFVGFTVGLCLVLFGKSQLRSEQAVSIISATLGGLFLAFIGGVFHAPLPIPALAIVGAVAALLFVLLFKKPHKSQRNFYL
jgi:uncharacterized membrane protein YoaK (UPF0700 family)